MARPQSEQSDSSSVRRAVAGDTSQSDTTTTKTTGRRPSGGGWLWYLFWSLALISLLAAIAKTLIWLLKAPPSPNCNEVSLQAGSNAPQQLYCAQKAAKSGETEDLIAALEVVANWSQDSPLYAWAAKWRDEWSQLLLAIARRQLSEKNDLEAARSLVKEIPENSMAYPEAQKVQQRWQKLHERAQGLYNQAQKAMKERNWSKSWNYIRKIQRFPHQPWREKRSQQLVEQIEVERKAWATLQSARDRLTWKTPQAYVQAIKTAQEVTPDTYARSPAQTDISRWGRTLLDKAFAQIQQQNYNQAIRIARLIPENIYLAPEAEKLVMLAQASSTLQKQDNPGVIGERLPYLFYLFLEARTVASSFSHSNPYFPTIHQMQMTWQDHSEDLSQLQFASLIAHLGHKKTLELATNQAQMVSMQRPRRLHAQTLNAHWQKQIHRLEDTPLLQQAQQQAQPGTVDAYRQAVELARGIEPQSPLYERAQTVITEWRQQAMLIADQRTIDRADELAQQEKYTAAVELVAEIGTKSPLYDRAQERIQKWRTKAELAAHRALLKAGKELAAQGKYTDAIIKVRTISPGEELYEESQQAIGRWLKARSRSR